MAYSSQYDQKVNDLYSQIENRAPFQYNASDDQLYQQYVDRYQNMGRKAMMDTMGQANALTGGYANSYSQNVGQQAYDEYLQGLNDKLMETYQLAYGQYQDQGNDLYNLFNAAGTLAQSDFDRYMQEAQFEWQKEQAAKAAAGGGGGYGGGGGSKKKGEDEDEDTYGQIELTTPGGSSYYVTGKTTTDADKAALQAQAQKQYDYMYSQPNYIWYRNG